MNFASANSILQISRTRKRFLALTVDVLLCVSTVFFSFYLRLGEWTLPDGPQWFSVAASLLFAIPLFISFGLYRAIFRYAGWGAFVAVMRVGVIYTLFYSAMFTLIGVVGVPRTVGLIQPILLFLAVGTSRAFARFWLGGGYQVMMRMGEARRTLIYGAGSAGRQLAAAMTDSKEVYVVGFIDDDESLQGNVLNGKMIYSPRNLERTISELNVSDVLLAIPSASRKRRNEIVEAISATSTAIRTLPGLMDLAQGRVKVNDLRELDIEDLLGRDAVSPNHILLGKNIANKVVLVTGAGGSIGSELCRQILRLKPEKLLLVELNEFALYSIHQELEKGLTNPGMGNVDVLPLLASAADETRMRSILSTWKPHTIYHAAAYKHVPLVESNPVEGVRNNVFGTLVTAQLAEACGVKDFVLVSTDKAVRPTNVMGASKRLAEMVLQAMSARQKATRFTMVRFGNVLGSSGSVVPLFRKQIREGGPVTVTHQEITRYFMTIPEAAQLVIQSGAMAAGGEVYVLDMGDPVKIIDLARRMIELSGLSVRGDGNPDGDIEISTTGLRPGEKLYEELLIGENPVRTNHPRIMKAQEHFLKWELLMPKIAEVKDCISQGDAEKLVEKLRELVPEFRSAENGKSSLADAKDADSTRNSRSA